MAELTTTSLAFPNMFDVARNRVSILENKDSVVNRCKLLLLTEPTEVYNELNQGVGLRRYLFQYNNDNVVALIKDRIIEQLRLYEPCCLPDSTIFENGLLFTGNAETNQVEQHINANKLQMTIGVVTKFGDKLEVTV